MTEETPLFPHRETVPEWELPTWAQKMLAEREDRRASGWYASDPFHERPLSYSKIVHIAFPNGVHYLVEKLDPNSSASVDGWRTLEEHHYVLETAISSAQKKAYHTDTPHRVRKVVWTD